MNVLHAGRLVKTKEDYKVVQLGLDYVEEVVELQERVHKDMVHKSWFVRDSADEIETMLKNGGALFGVLNKNNEMIASRYISTPGDSEHNLAHDVNLPIDLDQVVVLESTVVHPDYRGNRLQGITLDVAMKHAENKGFRHLFCTVSPQNIYSLYNIMSGGLKIRSLKKKYATTDRDGVWRFILHKDILIQDMSWLKRLEISFDDLDLQKILINKGFYGDAVSRRANTIVYAR